MHPTQEHPTQSETSHAGHRPSQQPWAGGHQAALSEQQNPLNQENLTTSPVSTAQKRTWGRRQPQFSLPHTPNQQCQEQSRKVFDLRSWGKRSTQLLCASVALSINGDANSVPPTPTPSQWSSWEIKGTGAWQALRISLTHRRCYTMAPSSSPRTSCSRNEGETEAQ